jgi:hypothetical protein
VAAVSSTAAVYELPQTSDETLADDISHELCCTDEQKSSDRISMCGLALSDDYCDIDVPSCTVCRDLIEQWAENVDLYGEDPQAPRDAPCRCCPRRFREGSA